MCYCLNYNFCLYLSPFVHLRCESSAAELLGFLDLDVVCADVDVLGWIVIELFGYIHIEAPDECGHRAELDNKVLSVEKIDSEILAPVLAYLRESGEDFKIMVLPDHPTPIRIRTHTILPVPFFIYSSSEQHDGVAQFSEDSATAKNFYVENGWQLMGMLTGK